MSFNVKKERNTISIQSIMSIQYAFKFNDIHACEQFQPFQGWGKSFFLKKINILTILINYSFFSSIYSLIHVFIIHYVCLFIYSCTYYIFIYLII